MFGVRVGQVLCLLLCLSGNVFGGEQPSDSHNPFKLLRPVVESLRPVAEAVGNWITNPASYLQSQRTRLIEELRDSPTDKIETRSKALKAYLSLEGELQIPNTELLRLIDELETAVRDSSDDKTIKAEALKKYLSPDGKGVILDKDTLKKAIEGLKEATLANNAKEAAKHLLKVLGPDGIRILGSKDKKIDAKKLAESLQISSSDKDGVTYNGLVAALEELLKSGQIKVTPAPLQLAKGAETAEQPVPVGSGTPLLNPPGGAGGGDEGGGGIPGFGADTDSGVGGLVNPADQEQFAFENLNDQLQRQLLEQELENERLRNQQNRNAGTRVNAPDNDKTGPQFPPVSVNGGGGSKGPGQPPQVPEPMRPEPLPQFPMPPPMQGNNDSGILVELIKAGLLGGNNSNEKKGDPTQNILNDINANSQRQLELANLQAMNQMMMTMAGLANQSRGGNGLNVSQVRNSRAIGNTLSARVSNLNAGMAGRQRQQKQAPNLRNRANGPFLAGVGRVKSKPQSLMAFAKSNATSTRTNRAFQNRRSLRPRGRFIR